MFCVQTNVVIDVTDCLKRFRINTNTIPKNRNKPEAGPVNAPVKLNRFVVLTADAEGRVVSGVRRGNCTAMTWSYDVGVVQTQGDVERVCPST